MSVISRLFVAMRIKRVLGSLPEPCRTGCVSLNRELALMAGL